MKKVKSNKDYRAYLIGDENDLDSCLAEEIKDFDSIHIKGDCAKIGEGGTLLFKVCFGEWLVVFSDYNIKNYNNEDFLSDFVPVECN